MTFADIYKVAGALIVSLGGGALLVFALSSWLAKVWANRILEKEKASYAAEIEELRRAYGEEIERIKLELQKNAFEHQTRFSWYHQRKAELIANVYAILNDVSEHVTEMVSPVQYGGEQQAAHAQKTIDLYNELASKYYGQKIFLEKDICEKVDVILKSIKKAITDFRLSQDPGMRMRELWGEAYKTMDKAVPPLRAELEETFRIMLSKIGPAA
jgi:hypothetical protein